MKRKVRIRGTFEFDNEWWEDIYSATEPGEIIVEEFLIYLRLGAVLYKMDEIISIDQVNPGGTSFGDWIKITHAYNSVIKIVTICPINILGFHDFYGTTGKYLLHLLYDFQERNHPL